MVKKLMKTFVYYRIDEDEIYLKPEFSQVCWTWLGPVGVSILFEPDQNWQLLGEL